MSNSYDVTIDLSQIAFDQIRQYAIENHMKIADLNYSHIRHILNGDMIARQSKIELTRYSKDPNEFMATNIFDE